MQIFVYVNLRADNRYLKSLCHISKHSVNNLEPVHEVQITATIN